MPAPGPIKFGLDREQLFAEAARGPAMCFVEESPVRAQGREHSSKVRQQHCLGCLILGAPGSRASGYYPGQLWPRAAGKIGNREQRAPIVAFPVAQVFRDNRVSRGQFLEAVAAKCATLHARPSLNFSAELSVNLITRSAHHANYKAPIFYRCRHRPDRGDHQRTKNRGDFWLQVVADDSPHTASLVVATIQDPAPLFVVLDEGVALVDQ
jgi:hypothetical protein